MFDDHQLNNSGQVPPNLPMGEPEDIFKDGGDSIPEPITISEPSIPSMGEETASPIRSAVGAGVLKPRQTPDQNQIEPTQYADVSQPSIPAVPSISGTNIHMTTPPQNMMGGNGDPNQMYTVSEPIGNRKVIMWIVVLVVLAILGFGSVWIYFSFIRKADPTDGFGTIPQGTVIDENIPSQTDTNVVVPSTGENATNTEDEFDLDSQILLGEPLDTDGDGLTDVRESELNTSPLTWDTDMDELGDYEEVTIWKTDPLEADTDGDGYSDNEEIKNGYSPKGPGKLFEPPTSTENVAPVQS